MSGRAAVPDFYSNHCIVNARLPFHPEDSGPCWFVGASISGSDQTDRFIDEGIWEHGFEDKHLDVVRSMQVGERIAIKASYTRKNGLTFDNYGQSVSVMAIKAKGVIVENPGDGHRVRVQCQKFSSSREWYFYTYQPTIWKITPGDWKTDALIDFTFNDKPQDTNRFRNDSFWLERFATDSADLKRFRWTRFYQAIADGLLKYRDNRVEGLSFLEGDQFSDGNSRGYISGKLRLPIGNHGPKNRCSGADYLQLIESLNQRFAEPDFSVHSFPER
jgi:5-methylcytosine-specific restriction protein B